MTNIFNSRFEISLRVLLILRETEDIYLSSDMLAAIDFIAVYGHDFGISNTNLHGNNLFKYSEFATRRGLVKEAVKNLVLKNLLAVECGKNGFTYTITSAAKDYCDAMESDYANTYRDMAFYAIDYTNNKSERDVLNLINEHSIRSLKKGGN